MFLTWVPWLRGLVPTWLFSSFFDCILSSSAHYSCSRHLSIALAMYLFPPPAMLFSTHDLGSLFHSLWLILSITYSWNLPFKTLYFFYTLLCAFGIHSLFSITVISLFSSGHKLLEGRAYFFLEPDTQQFRKSSRGDWHPQSGPQFPQLENEGLNVDDMKGPFELSNSLKCKCYSHRWDPLDFSVKKFLPSLYINQGIQ